MSSFPTRSCGTLTYVRYLTQLPLSRPLELSGCSLLFTNSTPGLLYRPTVIMQGEHTFSIHLTVARERCHAEDTWQEAFAGFVWRRVVCSRLWTCKVRQACSLISWTSATPCQSCCSTCSALTQMMRETVPVSWTASGGGGGGGHNLLMEAVWRLGTRRKPCHLVWISTNRKCT